MKYVLIGIAALVAIIGIGWIGAGNDFLLYKFWAPKQENVRREVFENTQSYVDGKKEYLSQLRFQYQTADEGHKAALRTLILSEASSVDNSKLPDDLRGFIEQLKDAN